MRTSRLLKYENKLLIFLSFVFGVVLFDRMALSFLVPFFEKELDLNNTHIGLLTSSLALTWALSGYLMGSLSDKTGKRKQYLIIAVTTFSICSFTSGLAEGFAFLLLSRMIMGLAEGPVLPLAQAIMMGASTEKRRGFNMGFMQTFGGGVLAVLAPIAVVALAATFGWRNTFFIAGLPGLILATLGYFFIKESAPTKPATKILKTSIAHLFQYRNVWVTIVLSCCVLIWLFAQVTFLPKYLISIKHFTAKDMGQMMAGLGLGGIIWGAIVPALSDKFGRKPMVIIFFLMSALMPLSVIYSGDSFLSLFMLVVLGSSISGCFPIVLATIPSETLPREYIAQAIGLIGGIGELAGGFLAPAVAGWSADRYGLKAPFIIAAIAAVAGGLVAFFLHETAPARLTKNIEPAPLQSQRE